MPELSCPDQILERLYMHEELPLVIVGTAAPDGIVMDYRLKRVGSPFIQRFGRLYIIMAIHQHRLERRVHSLASEHDRISACRHHIGHISPGFKQQFPEPFSATHHIGLVLLFGTYRWDSQYGEQFFEEPLPVLFNILFHFLRVRICLKLFP